MNNSAPNAALTESMPTFHGQACTWDDHELFFQDYPRPEDVADAKAICAACPARTRCLSFAQRNRIDWGIWGGMTADERRKMRRRP